MKSERLLGVLLTLAIFGTLSGCQLARTDGDGLGDPRLVGVLVTPAGLGSQDMASQGRLDAALVRRPTVNEQTGTTSYISEYVFQGVEGVPCFVAKAPLEGEEGMVFTAGLDSSVSDGNLALCQGDDKESMEIRGTIYYGIDPSRAPVRVNPVYQDSDGVYALPGNAVQFASEHGEGVYMTTSLKETATATEGGHRKSMETSVSISLAIMFRPEKIVLLQMDSDSEVVSREEYAPGNLPSAIVPENTATYIIVETHKRAPEGGLVVSRTIYSRSDEIMAAFYCRDDGVCLRQWSDILWP